MLGQKTMREEEKNPWRRNCLKAFTTSSRDFATPGDREASVWKHYGEKEKKMLVTSIFSLSNVVVCGFFKTEEPIENFAGLTVVKTREGL